MEIPRIGIKSTVASDKKSITSKKGFSQDLNSERQKQSHEQMKKLLDDIKKKGNRLVITKCYADVKSYKELIKNYLDSVLSYMYSVKKDISFWQTQYFITVDTVDKKLEELTKMLLSQEKENLDIASTIDEITGLIVDIYR